MPPKAKNLARKKATREGHRTTVKRIACTVNEQLDAPISDELDQSKQALHVSTLRQKRESLRSKLETLKVLDEDILSNVEEEEIENEIREADLVSELIQLSIARIDNFLETPRPPAKSVDMPEQHETPVSPHISASTEVASGNTEPLISKRCLQTTPHAKF